MKIKINAYGLFMLEVSVLSFRMKLKCLYKSLTLKISKHFVSFGEGTVIFLKIMYWDHLVWMGNEPNECKNVTVLDCSCPLEWVD